MAIIDEEPIRKWLLEAKTETNNETHNGRYCVESDLNDSRSFMSYFVIIIVVYIYISLKYKEKIQYTYVRLNYEIICFVEYSRLVSKFM